MEPAEQGMVTAEATRDVESGQIQDRAVQASPPPPASASPVFVYAIGRVELRFPSLAVEKEYAQAVGQVDTSGMTDRQVMHNILSDRANRYLLRQLCWVFSVQGLETYLLAPRESADLDLLVEAVRAEPAPEDLDAIIGMLGPLAAPESCNGLVVPVVAFDQIYSFDRGALLDALPVPEGLAKKDRESFRATASELLDRILQLTDNAGARDEHRALNYLAMRYPAIYTQAARSFADSYSLASVDVQSSRLSATRSILDVIFSYRHRQTDVLDKYFVRVDVTEEFPFLVTKLSPYYDR
jgi:PatG C-terminal